MTSEWEQFVAGLTPALLERERSRVHGDLEQERFGSRADLEMRVAHDWLKNERTKPRPGALETRRTQMADADTFTTEHGGTVLAATRPAPAPPVSDEELDQRFAAYAAARKAAA